MAELTERNLIIRLKNYLLKHGYPEESILIEYKIGRYRADLVVIDTQTNIPIQIFELKARKNEQSIQMGKRQLESYMEYAKKINPDIITYLVFPKDTSPYFEAIDINTDEEVTTDAFNYKNQAHRGRVAKEELIKDKKNEAVDNLKIITYILIISAAIFLILDICCIIPMTNYRLYLILIIIVLVLLPYYETIKVANFELTQKKKCHNIEENTKKRR